MRERSELFLVAGAVLNLMIALSHLMIVFIGPEAYVYFGAGEEMARMDREGSPLPDAITVFLAIGFCIFAVYGLSGADIIRRLPARRPILTIIAAIYLFRGMLLLQQGYVLITDPYDGIARDIFFSMVAVIVGICYAAGAKSRWRVIR